MLWSEIKSFTYLDVRYMSIDHLRQIRAGRGFDEAKNFLMYFEAWGTGGAHF